MKIEEIKNKCIKISANSITIYDDRGKTCGIVKNVCSFTMLKPSEQIKHFHNLRDAGVWGDSDLIKCAVVCDNKLYYLHNIRPIENYKKYFENKSGFENETKRYKERIKAAKNMESYAVVIPCYVR